MDKYYLIGKVKGKKTIETEYGPCTFMYVSVLKSTQSEVKGTVKCVCYKANSKAAEKRANNLLVMVQFKKHKIESYQGKLQTKVLASDVSPSNWREYQVLAVNEEGQFDPRA